MYAIFEDGTRQYRVSEGDIVKLDFREDADIGTELELNRVLVFQNDAEVQIGQPALEGARVIAEVIEFPSEKTTTQKFRRRKNSRRFTGHRQPYTLVEIMYLLLPGMERPEPKDEEEEEKTGEEGYEEETQGGEESGEETGEEEQ